MRSILPSRTCPTASLLRIHRIIHCWMVAAAVWTLGGCVSSQTYENARQEAKGRANELAQAQADVQSLEQQRDAAHAANQQDERALGNLKGELQAIQASFDQIRKDNQARLADLQHRIAVLRARHQIMLKEISETKRHEKQLEVLTAQRERDMASMPSRPEGHVSTIDALQSEPRRVAVITPRPPQPEASSHLSLASVPSASDTVPATSTSPSPAALQTTSTASAVPVSASNATKPAAVKSATAASTAGMPSVPHNDTWFSAMTEWLASMFDWIWS